MIYDIWNQKSGIRKFCATIDDGFIGYSYHFTYINGVNSNILFFFHRIMIKYSLEKMLYESL